LLIWWEKIFLLFVNRKRFTPAVCAHFPLADDSARGYSGVDVASASVGDGDPAVSYFRWAEITPIVLAPGDGYIIASVRLTGPMRGDPFTWAYSGEVILSNPAIEVVMAAWDYGNSLEFRPGNLEEDDLAYFGPSFSILSGGAPPVNGSQIPEPGTWALMLAGLGALAAFRPGVRRR
jgi:hypothetical protein